MQLQPAVEHRIGLVSTILHDTSHIRNSLIRYGLSSDTTVEELCEEFIPREDLRNIILGISTKCSELFINKAIAVFYGHEVKFSLPAMKDAGWNIVKKPEPKPEPDPAMLPVFGSVDDAFKHAFDYRGVAYPPNPAANTPQEARAQMEQYNRYLRAYKMFSNHFGSEAYSKV